MNFETDIWVMLICCLIEMGRFEEALPGNILDENYRESLPAYSKIIYKMVCRGKDQLR